jgi:two-component system CheB/CheR fusion protein
MNEELQSTNDELHTINDTLRERSTELDETKFFLDSLVDSVRLGIVVVDREMRIVLWNNSSEELWGLRSEEVIGAPLASLDMGLPLAKINPLIGKIFVEPNTVEDTAIDAVNRRGKQVRVRVTCTAFGYNGDSASGALLTMDANV